MVDHFTVGIYVAPPMSRVDGGWSVGHTYIGIIAKDANGNTLIDNNGDIQGSFFGLHPKYGDQLGITSPAPGVIEYDDNKQYINTIFSPNAVDLTLSQAQSLVQYINNIAASPITYSLERLLGDNCARWADKTLQEWGAQNGMLDANGNNKLDFYPDLCWTPSQVQLWYKLESLGSYVLRGAFKFIDTFIIGGTPAYGATTESFLCVGEAMRFCREYMGAARNTVTNSPIALDLGSNGLNLISKDDSSAFFDMDMDGFREKVQWLGAGDAFLARDVDGNGRIDDRTELFGDTEGFADGWAKLATLDSNSDGIISADDTAWGALLVWRDLDGDGFSDAGELVSLDEAGVASISLDADAALSSTFTRTDGTTGQAKDIYLDQDPMLTTYGGDFTLDPETLFLL